MGQQYITNAEVKEAIDDCINTRWAPAAASGDGMLLKGAPQCQLCILVGKISSRLLRGVMCHEACPLAIYNNGRGCGRNSAYQRWEDSETDPERKAAAQAMVDELISCREHFFG